MLVYSQQRARTIVKTRIRTYDLLISDQLMFMMVSEPGTFKFTLLIDNRIMTL